MLNPEVEIPHLHFKKSTVMMKIRSENKGKKPHTHNKVFPQSCCPALVESAGGFLQGPAHVTVGVLITLGCRATRASSSTALTLSLVSHLTMHFLDTVPSKDYPAHRHTGKYFCLPTSHTSSLCSPFISAVGAGLGTPRCYLQVYTPCFPPVLSRFVPVPPVLSRCDTCAWALAGGIWLLL